MVVVRSDKNVSCEERLVILNSAAEDPSTLVGWQVGSFRSLIVKHLTVYIVVIVMVLVRVRTRFSYDGGGSSSGKNVSSRSCCYSSSSRCNRS